MRIIILYLSILFLHGQAEAQNRDVILDRVRVDFTGIGMLNGTIIVNGMTENYGSTLALQPFLVHLNPDLTIHKSYHIPNDTIYDFFPIRKCINENQTDIMCLGIANSYEKTFLNQINTSTKKLNAKYTFSDYSEFKYYSFAEGLIGLQDSGYIIHGGYNDFDGSTTGGIGYNLFLQRLDKKGEQMWVKIEGSKRANEVIEDGFYRDGKITVGISVDSTWWPFAERRKYFYIHEYGLNGNLTKKTPYLNHDRFYPFRMLSTDNKGWILGGLIYDTTIDYSFDKAGIVKTDSNLKIQWSINFNDIRDRYSRVKKIIRLSDGNYLAAAMVSADSVWREYTELIKFNEVGQVIWKKRFRFSPLSNENTDEIKDLLELPNGDVIGVGRTSLRSLAIADSFRVQRGWLLKINKNGDVLSSIASNSNLPRLSIYPNPFVERITIEHLEPQMRNLEIDLINSAGSVVVHKTMKVNGESIDLEINQSISKGIYYLRITQPDTQQQSVYRLEKQ